MIYYLKLCLIKASNGNRNTVVIIIYQLNIIWRISPLVLFWPDSIRLNKRSNPMAERYNGAKSKLRIAITPKQYSEDEIIFSMDRLMK